MSKKKKTGSLFWKIFAVTLVLFCIAMVLLLRKGYDLMMDYDASQSFPIQKTREIAALLEKGDYSVLTENGGDSNVLYFNGAEYEESVRKDIEEAGGCTVEKGFSSNRFERPVYVILAGERKLCSVEFCLIDKKTKYGFSDFMLDRIVPEISGQYSIKVLVPETCSLWIGDIEISDRFKTGESVELPVTVDDYYLRRDGEGKPILLERSDYYLVDGLLTEPTATLVYRDTGKSPKLHYSEKYGAWTVKTDEITLTAPSNYRITVNGICISEDERFVVPGGYEVKDLAVSQQYTPSKVSMVKYRVSGLRDTDGITVTGVDFFGNTAVPTYSEEDRSYEFALGVSPENYAEKGLDRDALIMRAENYARFMQSDGDRWSIILPYVLRGTQVWTDFESFWVVFSTHDSFWIENEKVNSVIFYTPELFVANVTMDYWIKGYNHETDNVKVYYDDVTFYYALVDGKWMIVDYRLN